MKKIVLLFAAAISLSAAQAQIHLGIKAGANINKIDGKDFKDGFNFNYLAGAFAEIGLGGRIAIQPEVLFNQSTSTYTDEAKETYNIKNDQLKAKLNYLSIPLLVNIKVAGPLHIVAGPQYSILLNKDDNLWENGKNAFKSGDFSAVGGVQLQFGGLRVGGRYMIGLNNISDINHQDEWKNQAAQISLGFAF